MVADVPCASLARSTAYARCLLSFDAVPDRGYFSSPEILDCHEAGTTVTQTPTRAYLMTVACRLRPVSGRREL